MKKSRFLWPFFAVVLLLSACSSDNDDKTANGNSPTTASVRDDSNNGALDDGSDDADDNADDATDDNTSAGSASGGDGTISLGDTTISVSTLCHLKEQPAAAGGGKILFVVQANGVTAEGEEVFVDISRYDEDSMFAGDSIDLIIGDFRAEDHMNYSTMGADGGLTLQGSTLTVNGVELNADDLSETIVFSAQLSC